MTRPTPTTELMVAEVFGPTIQGEGPSTGRRAAFVRLGRCNLDCSFCDTPYTWDWRGKNGTKYTASKELSRVTVDAVVGRLSAMLVDLVVITGGEPLLQAAGCTTLVARLSAWRTIDDVTEPIRVEFETNGTLQPPPALGDLSWVHFNVSPKLANSGTDPHVRYQPKVLDYFATHPRAIFKFVITDPDDLEEVHRLVNTHHIPPSRVWLMPEGRTPDALAARTFLADTAIECDYNLSGRLHVQLWGDARGH